MDRSPLVLAGLPGSCLVNLEDSQCILHAHEADFAMQDIKEMGERNNPVVAAERNEQIAGTTQASFFHARG